MSSIAEILWVEKYRPRSLSDIVNQKEIVERLKKFVAEKNMPHLLFAGPAGTGKCVTYETPVLTREGLVKIGELVEKVTGGSRGFSRARIRVYSLKANGSIGAAYTSHVFKGTSPRTVLVELESGRRVEATPEHPLLAISYNGEPEWIPAEELRAGDYVATPLAFHEPAVGGDEKLVALAGLAGLLRSLWRSGGASARYCGDRETLETVTRVTSSIYGPKYRVAPGEGGEPCIELPLKLVNDLYARLGLKEGHGVYEGIPSLLWRSPEGLRAYLKALLAGSLETSQGLSIKARTRGEATELLYALASIGVRARMVDTEEAYGVLVPWDQGPGEAEAGPMAGRIYWDRVARVVELRGEKPVYDLTVPGYGNFIGGHGPLILHNTTAAHALSRDLYGDNYRQYVLELNASDERGINVIREKVKEFARSRSPAGIPFKIVILDEADNMTSDAQQALRRLMELFSASTRFILIANYPSKIIDPIQSRCAYFRFQPLRKEDVIERLRYIAENESVEYDEEALDTIYEISEGDMRKAINILQSSAALGKVTVESVFRVVGMAKPKEVRDMIRLALNGDFSSARGMLRKLMIEYGLSGEDVVRQVHKEVMGPELKISDDLRVLIADYLGEIHYRMVEGSDEDIQLSAFLAWLAMLGKKAGGKS